MTRPAFVPLVFSSRVSALAGLVLSVFRSSATPSTLFSTALSDRASSTLLSALGLTASALSPLSAFLRFCTCLPRASLRLTLPDAASSSPGWFCPFASLRFSSVR